MGWTPTGPEPGRRGGSHSTAPLTPTVAGAHDAGFHPVGRSLGAAGMAASVCARWR
jgi:hypothetical protein